MIRSIDHDDEPLNVVDSTLEWLHTTIAMLLTGIEHDLF